MCAARHLVTCCVSETSQQVPAVLCVNFQVCISHTHACIHAWSTLTYFQQHVVSVSWLVTKQAESRAVEVKSRLYSLPILY